MGNLEKHFKTLTSRYEKLLINKIKRQLVLAEDKDYTKNQFYKSIKKRVEYDFNYYPYSSELSRLFVHYKKMGIPLERILEMAEKSRDFHLLQWERASLVFANRTSLQVRLEKIFGFTKKTKEYIKYLLDNQAISDPRERTKIKLFAEIYVYNKILNSRTFSNVVIGNNLDLKEPYLETVTSVFNEIERTSQLKTINQTILVLLIYYLLKNTLKTEFSMLDKTRIAEIIVSLIGHSYDSVYKKVKMVPEIKATTSRNVADLQAVKAILVENDLHSVAALIEEDIKSIKSGGTLGVLR